jgi:hypothetical protein
MLCSVVVSYHNTAQCHNPEDLDMNQVQVGAECFLLLGNICTTKKVLQINETVVWACIMYR